MAGREQDNRIFVGGLSWDVSERQLEDAFSRFGKIVDSQIMVERDTGRSRGFGFLTFADRRGMEDAIREMHGKEFGDRSISVNRAEPRMGSDDPGNGYGGGGGYSSGGRGSYGGGERSAGPDDCYKCGRPGHWARDCPLAGGGGGGRDGGDFSSRPRYGAPIGRGSRFGGERDRYIDDRYDVGRYDDRDRYDTRDRYGSRDRYVPDRYPVEGERYAAPDRYGGVPDRYPQNGYGKDRGYDRDVAPRGGGGGRYGGGSGGPSRYEGRSYSDRAAPYDRPRRGGGRPSSYDRY